MKEEQNGLRAWLIGSAVTIATALVLQTGVLLWWAGGITARVDRVERDVSVVGERVHSLELGKR